MSEFFIHRPIFAWVLAIGVMMAGILGISTLPIAQYPDIAPPSISITAVYPGASAQTVQSSVTQVIEQQLTGIDGLLYFSSSSSSAGTASITVTFAKGTDPDIAQVQVQNKVAQANSRLPSEVQQEGVTVAKSNSDFLLIVGLYDTTGKSGQSDVADWMVNNLQDDISRINGVGQAQLFGSGYAMRIWLEPQKLAAVQLMPSDVASAVKSQNVDLSAGQLGQLPAVTGQQLTAIVNAKSRLQTPEQFRRIVVKTETDGTVIHLSDVARVEMGSDSYATTAQYNGKPAAGLSIQLAPDADALKTAEAIKTRVAQLTTHLPPGYAIVYPRDTTSFIKLSVNDVEKTLLVAIILVVLVMFVFLQDWRATLIPAIAVPVVLLGTFGILAVFGYSINTLTLFGMVLAIGLLVDDAIVVVENVVRVMDTENLTPTDATSKSMAEIGSALVGIALVLSAVLLPMAFFGGSTGVIYRQFSITIVSAMVLSVMAALILTPALCGTLLKPSRTSRLAGHGLGARFNRRFDRVTERYVATVGVVLGRSVIHLLVYAGIIVVIGVMFVRLPSGFLPNEDQGIALVQYTLPTGAAQSRTDAVRTQVDDFYLGPERRNVVGLMTIDGYNFSGSSQNAGFGFITLAPFSDRKGSANTVDAINARATNAFARISDAQVFALTPPPISGLGQSNGFTFELQNSTGLLADRFETERDQLIAAANKDPQLTGVRMNSLADTSQLKVTLDEAKLAVLGLAESDVTATLSAAWGGSYINDFIDRGRVKKVYMQADAPYRMLPGDLGGWFVRSSAASGGAPPTMVPFSSIASTTWEKGPTALSRFNGLPSYEILGSPAPGISSGAAMQRMAELSHQYAPGTTYAWSALSYQENVSSGEAPLLYGLSLLVVFLSLAALYESWSIPFAVMMVIPLGVIGAVLAVTVRGLENNIYFQIGLLTTMGLAAKNAILIVEFADAVRKQGKDAGAAALEAARMRLRPILMTSVAFVAGVFPLAIATGAGAASRIAIGTTVIGGMLTATAIAIFYVPLFFVVVLKVFRRSGAPSPVNDVVEGVS
ncbi:efflux RND transporter permease subunit [Sphingomonas faeni]|uniref:efflux RND transporter permease subunit n=1 Tax=Sphingomonas faeni TaxID=185950 RepID=UPI002783D55C|nr:efflux RND transporter permease subunit [Sphingomonas faeni]MDQ0839314.1 multidrug efflux pump [Sphingomonas faeni]